jgi:hypothetical protein
MRAAKLIGAHSSAAFPQSRPTTPSPGPTRLMLSCANLSSGRFHKEAYATTLSTESLSSTARGETPTPSPPVILRTPSPMPSTNGKSRSKPQASILTPTQRPSRLSSATLSAPTRATECIPTRVTESMCCAGCYIPITRETIQAEKCLRW